MSGAVSSNRECHIPIEVTSTISRASYGVWHRTTFDPEVHLQQDKVWDETSHEWEARNQMTWYLKKAPAPNAYSREKTSQPKLQCPPWYLLYEADGSFDATFKVTICQCQEDTPPTRQNNSVKVWATIKCSIYTPFWDLEDHWNKAGVRVKKLDHYIEMVPSGASIEFAVVVNGKKVGKSQFQTHFS
ncbi:hypothetical protein NW759_007731 [Fusarium solani]|nr:hypothetical protein NW759_007731 [Fusarium solani]